MQGNLYLRKVAHPQARDNYRVILKYDGLETEIGSIGIQQGSGATEAWVWAIDTVARGRRTGHRPGPQGLHAAVQGGLGQVQCRSCTADRISPGKAEAPLMS
jgi:hypothetical protein